MNFLPRISIALTLVLWVSQLPAYEVWMGTHLSTSEMANDLASWSNAASQLEGFNVNRAPHDTDPASNNEYRTIFQQFTNSGATMTEFARSQATRDPDMTDELAFPSIASRLGEIFSIENSFGYNLTILMFYDERGTFQGNEYLYEWTDIEIQYLRDWLDANGQEDVELMWNVRNNSVRNQQLAAHPLVDSVEIEASTTALLNNTNNQITFFNWYWTNPATANKRIALQIPRTLDSLNQFRGTRRVAQMIGESIGYGDDGMRSDRLIFLPVTYNDNFPYIPETVSGGTAYTNTLTSIALSLLEQRELFEGRLPNLPTIADADSTTRTPPPTISPIADQVIEFGGTLSVLPFAIDDEDTPLASLTLSATSSNTGLVSDGNISFGGSGGNRTISATPSSGQSGTSEITVVVSDGTWSARTSFRVTVGGTLLSVASDATVRDNLVAIEASNPNTQLGAGGVSPFVDRCTVYVFQLPDLGAVSAPFIDASFLFNYESKNGTLKDNDLYGLGRRSSSTVLGGDYYGQSSSLDPSDAVRLQANILTNASPLGAVGTSDTGDQALRDYLNDQYEAGAGIGEYVFLRLNTAAPKTGINRAFVTMSEGGVAGTTQDTRPRIVYQGDSPAPTVTSIPDQTLSPNSSTGALPFTIGDDTTPAGSLTLSGTSSNTALVPNSSIVFGGADANRTVTVTPPPGSLGIAEITVEVGDGTYTTATAFTVAVEGTPELIAGWDHWDSNSAPSSTVTASGILASATASGTGGNWSITDSGDDPGRGSSGDTTWGSFDGNGAAAGTVTNIGQANMSLTNGKVDGEITLTITNQRPTAIHLDNFHMDAVAFRRNAARTYALNVLPGSDITVGNVVTSGAPTDDNSTSAITTLDGELGTGHDVHDDLDLSLSGLVDHTLEAGEVAIIQIAFYNGTGEGGGHHLFLDNVAVSGIPAPLTGAESWRAQHFGTPENSGTAADTFDANSDGESNLLEFATNQDPYAATGLETLASTDGSTISFLYTKSKAAVGDGITFTVEWSDTAIAGSWSDTDVTERLAGEDDTSETIVATIPAGMEGRRFVRLVITP